MSKPKPKKQVSHSIRMNCPASKVFAVWADVSRWHEWDPDTRSASLDGPFVVGSSGPLVPGKGRAVKMTVVEVTPNRSFTVEVAVLGSRMRFDHTAQDEGRACTVTHTVAFSGWLAGILMATVGRQVNAGLPITLAKLKARCEAG